MTRTEIHERVATMLAETFEIEPDQIRPESRLYEDLDLDSIDALDMVVKLQELMRRRVDEQEMRKLRTVGDVTEMIENVMRDAGTERAG
jgi:acyl carrier protein